jgi:copper resistance protein D
MHALAHLATLPAADWVRAVLAALSYAGALLAMGAPLLRLALRGMPEAGLQALHRAGAVGAGLAALALLAQWPTQAALLGGGAEAAFDPMLLQLVFDSPQGERMLLALAGLVLLALGRRLGLLAELAGLLLLLWSFAMVGHSHGELRPLRLALLWLHLLALGTWLAGLWPIHVLSRVGPGQRAQAADLMERFGRLGLLFVPTLVIAGGVFALLLLGAWQALLESAYGQLLIAKIVLVAAILALAALNKLWWVRGLAADRPGAARGLRITLALEAALIAAALLLTATLTSSTPPAEAQVPAEFGAAGE